MIGATVIPVICHTSLQMINTHHHHNHSYMKRRDLALEYFPGKKPVEAVRNLRRWINNCPKLKEELLAINPNFFGLRYLTLTEVRLIKYYLGDP